MKKMTKDLSWKRLGVINHYAQWDKQTDLQTDITTFRLNWPFAQLVKRIKNFVLGKDGCHIGFSNHTYICCFCSTSNTKYELYAHFETPV